MRSVSHDSPERDRRSSTGTIAAPSFSNLLGQLMNGREFSVSTRFYNSTEKLWGGTVDGAAMGTGLCTFCGKVSAGGVNQNITGGEHRHPAEMVAVSDTLRFSDERAGKLLVLHARDRVKDITTVSFEFSALNAHDPKRPSHNVNITVHLKPGDAQSLIRAMGERDAATVIEGLLKTLDPSGGLLRHVGVKEPKGGILVVNASPQEDRPNAEEPAQAPDKQGLLSRARRFLFGG